VGFPQIPTKVGGVFGVPHGIIRSMVGAALVPLVLILAVAAGLVTATVSASWVHSRQTAFHRWLLANILLFNLLILLGLVFHLTRTQLPGTSAARGAFLLVLVTLMAPLKLGWLCAFAGMNRAVLAEELPPAWGRRIGWLAGLLVVVYGALLAVGATVGRPRLVEATVALFDILVLGGAVVSAGCLVSSAWAVPAPVRRRALMAFGGLHVLVLVAAGGSFALGWLRAEDHQLFTGLLLIAYNLLPLAWFPRFQPAGPGALRAQENPYGLTPREREIIELISAGRSNQEIADRLFVSLATVKDHNHNIFRKAGVRSRLELANLFRDQR
jgi:DNA-binding CsgD family transcriptional regulator